MFSQFSRKIRENFQSLLFVRCVESDFSNNRHVICVFEGELRSPKCSFSSTCVYDSTDYFYSWLLNPDRRRFSNLHFVLARKRFGSQKWKFVQQTLSNALDQLVGSEQEITFDHHEFSDQVEINFIRYWKFELWIVFGGERNFKSSIEIIWKFLFFRFINAFIRIWWCWLISTKNVVTY